MFFKCFNKVYYWVIIQFSVTFSWEIKVFHNICEVFAKYFYQLRILGNLAFFFHCNLIIPSIFSDFYSEKLDFTVPNKGYCHFLT